MTEKEAKELIKNYVLENFDDRWHPEPIYLEEYHDYFRFWINSKKYFMTREFGHVFVGLGASYLSKKFGNIVIYGSASIPQNCLRDFLTVEYRLNFIKTKYELEYPDYDYHYNVIIFDITNLDKASKYINNLLLWRDSDFLKEIKSKKLLEFNSVDYLGLLNFLYFNVIDPFCECSYQKSEKKYGRQPPLRTFISLNEIESPEQLFYKHMADRVKNSFPTFEINKGYSAKIFEIFDKNKFEQYFLTFSFKYYREDEPTGLTGYFPYFDDEKEEIMKDKIKSFDFVEGGELLFFLFMNTLDSFCEIEIEKTHDDLNIL